MSLVASRLGLGLTPFFFAACSVLIDSGQSAGGGGDGGLANSLPPPDLVDCGDPTHSTEDPCRTIDTLQPGAVGSGLALAWRSEFGDPRLDVVGGAVHGGELYLAVRRNDPTGEGGIMAVDVESGARRLVSGQLSVMGGTMAGVGSGNGFQGLSGVGVSSGGNVFALLLPEFTGFSGFMLDIGADGNRTTRSIGTDCAATLPSDLVIQDSSLPALLPDSSFYLVAQNIQSEWLVRINGEQCELLDTIPLQAAVESMAWSAGEVWMVDVYGSSLLAYDTVSGKSRLVAAPTSGSPGLEENPIGSGGLAVGNVVFGAGGEIFNRFRLVEVNRATGSRRVLPSEVGPARSVPKTRQLVFLHPTRAALLLVIDGAVVVYDPKSGNNNVLSY
ncbi:MAG: hypothetical protein R3B13_15140 [Polyangiaceae bacterium]